MSETFVMPVATNYLEMRKPPEWYIAAAPCNSVVIHIKKPHPDYYLSFYEEIGRRYQWVDRLMMTDRELRDIIEDDRIEVYVMYVGSRKAGFAELDRRVEGEIELAYFGLFDEFIGKGYGKYLLRWIVKRAWDYRPNRLWVHTCALDHKAALPNYLKVGFEIYDQKCVMQKLPL